MESTFQTLRLSHHLKIIVSYNYNNDNDNINPHYHYRYNSDTTF